MLGRIIGGFIVGLVTFGLLNWPWDLWELSKEVQVTISVILGLIYAALGGNIWKWISNISHWS